jgi:hypothetical protein
MVDGAFPQALFVRAFCEGYGTNEAEGDERRPIIRLRHGASTEDRFDRFDRVNGGGHASTPYVLAALRAAFLRSFPSS